MNTKNQIYAKMVGTGTFLPGSPIPFDNVEDYLGAITKAPEKLIKWHERMKHLMREMLDVQFYHYAIDPITKEFTEDNISMSVKAAKIALDSANMKAEEVELIVYASAHQDQMPTASVRIQAELGIEACAELSIHANCTSAYKAVMVANDLIKNGRYKNALVISSSMSSSELRADYYNQEIVKKEELFLRYFLCDGAGALVFKATDSHTDGLFLENAYIESIGGKKPSAMLNHRPAYWMNPKEEYEKGYHHISQMFQEQLRENFHDADGTVFFKGLKRMIDKYEIDLGKLKFFQVNFPSKHISELIIEECESLGIKKEALYSKISTMGYLGPPMVFVCIDKIFREEKLQKGDLILSFVTEVSKFMQAGFSLQNL
ncbi:MAG: 3-oxoacyl-ACP synthase [Bacteroidetes bacterium]|nr:3-oxoacyl-ACP synthase [Bacteroidota bacterium]